MPGWGEVRAGLAGSLAALEDGEFLVLGEPEAEPGPARGLFRRRAAPAPTRYVQFRCEDGTVYAECVGATLFGGDWEVDPATHERLRAMGWLLPDEGDGSGAAYPNYWCRHPQAGSADLASLGTEALRLLGVDPDVLEQRRDR